MAGARPRGAPLTRELRALGRTLGSPAPYTVIVWALLILGLAYQARPRYAIDVGSRTDLAFWNGVNGGEKDATGATFRWTAPSSALTLPGVGRGSYRLRLDLNGSRPPGFPPPQVVVEAGGQTLTTLHPDPARKVYDVAVPAPATRDGDLRVVLRTTNPFEPKGDPRQLGVTLYHVDIEPQDGGPALPPLVIWLQLTGAALLAALLLGLAGWGPGAVRLGGLLWALAEAGFLLFDRLWLTPIAGTLIGVLLGAGLALVLLGPLWRALFCAGGIGWPDSEQRWLLGIYGFAFVARLAGQLHPQTVVIDLIFHQHNLERVLGGRLLFTIASDEWGGRQTFYLPTPYIFMAPLQWLLNDELLTIRLFTVALDTLGVFLVYYLAKRAFGDGRAGLLAAGLLVTFPLATLPFSWGITANVFGQFWGLAAITIAVGAFERLTQPGPWLLLTAALTLALLSHPGSVQLTGLLIGGALLVWLPGAARAWRGGRRADLRAWGAMAGALAVACLLAWFGYYSHFAAAQLQTLGEIRQERAATQAAQGFSIKTGGEVNDISLGLRQRIARSRSAWLAQGLEGFASEAWAYFHTWPLLWAGLGLYAARRGIDPARRRMTGAAVVWAGVALLYAFVGWYANLYVRYPLFLLPLVALGAGLLLSALARRGRAGAWLVRLIMLGAVLDALAFWYMRITFANK
jgi:hypothetical protein